MKNWSITLFIIGTIATVFSFKESLNRTVNNRPYKPIRNTVDNTPITVKDIDGNVYHTIVIGTQTWMKENLKTIHYRDGSAIKEAENNPTWADTYNTNSQTSAWCYYESNASNNAHYGKLYNWYVVTDSRNVCPTGWHIPADSEWTVLSNYLGGDAIAGGKMKSVTLWKSPNTSGDNSSGFTGLPGGYRLNAYSFEGISSSGYWWSSTGNAPNHASLRFLTDDDSNIYDSATGQNYSRSGFSIRCLKDK